MAKTFRGKAFLFLFILVCSGLAQSARAQETKPTETKAAETKNIDTKPAAEIRTGKAPIIIIPGLTGSELVNGKNQEIVWFRPGRAKEDDLRLPISPVLSRNRDSLQVRDIIREVELVRFLPEIEIYQRLVEALEKRGGYTEGKWGAPAANGDKDTFYVFPYDWRRDNVENARLLMRQIDALKRKLKRPNLKFNVISHSMGGLIARYAAMYGDADLPRGGALRPTWTGRRNFDKIFLLGTPNEGSVQALDSMLNGFSFIGGGINLPFVQNLSKFDVFTIPSIYQLLPNRNSFKAYDENLKPLKIDLYDPKTWETYNWSIWQEKDFAKKFSKVEQRQAKAYFNVALARARRFHESLAANRTLKPPVSFYLMGADCKETQSAIVLVRDEKKSRWRTILKSDSFERASGEKVSSDDVKKLIYAQGDGVVTKSSLQMENALNRLVLPVASELYQCEAHNRLVTNPEIQDRLLTLLGATPIVTAAK
jgi:pimeloyl-ACP methyl ester carboxylesterase